MAPEAGATAAALRLVETRRVGTPKEPDATGAAAAEGLAGVVEGLAAAGAFAAAAGRRFRIFL